MTLLDGRLGPRPTALLAEDDENDVFLIRRALDRLNILERLVIVRDGNQTIDYLQGFGKYADRQTYPFPDVLVLDQVMPLLSGLDLLVWIRSHPSFEHLPVVILSLSLAPAQIEMANILGAACCPKTAHLEELPTALENAQCLTAVEQVGLTSVLNGRCLLETRPWSYSRPAFNR